MNSAIRPPAVAGFFYPADPLLLRRTVDDLLAAAPGMPVLPKALVVPHAGYPYSGATAARAFAALRPLAGTLRRVVLLGPTHRVAVHGIAVPGVDAFATPLGNVPIDRAALALLDGLPQIVVSDAAHADEHALEVQLPFLQRMLGHFALVPLAVGRTTPAAVAEVIEALWGGAETLIVVSSDLSHYLPYAVAREVDRDTAHRIEALDAHLTHDEACGATPLNGLLIAARHRGLNARRLDLCNSGDTAGDRQRVVGYAAFAFETAAP